MEKKDITVVICCAGIGTRLGIGYPKSLIDINGKPLIIRILEQLNDYDDIRIVVGFQAEKIIETVNNYRKDIMYVFNYDYNNTSIVESINRALKYSRKYVVQIDGDLVIDGEGFCEFMKYPKECVGITEINSKYPIFTEIEKNKIVSFSKKQGNKEWVGLVKIESKKLYDNKEFVFQILEQYLPLPYVLLDARDIDTPDDYDEAISWFKKKKEKK